MPYRIVIPTYHGHLKQVALALSSFEKFLTDTEVFIHLIVSRNEVPMFTELATKFKQPLVITVTSLSEILKKEENVEVDEDSLLKQIGKFNFQSLKKIYGVKHFGIDTTLVLDSEALMIREGSFVKVFEEYMNDPFIIYTSPTGEEIKSAVAHTSFEILNQPFQDVWFFDYYYWFFEKKYVDELFAHIFQTTEKSLYENLLYRKPVFEYNLYALYLYLYHKNEYRFIDAKKLLGEYLDQQSLKAYGKAIGGTESFEYLCWGITKENTPAFLKLFENMHLAFFRYDDRRGDADAQAMFVQKNKNILLLTSRMTTRTFLVDGYTVPMNFSQNDNKATSSIRGISSRIIQYGIRFSRKARIRLTEILYDTWYSLVLKVQLDKNNMLVRYHASDKELKIDKNLAFDVGAYTGTSLKRLRTLGYQKIICFEPSPRSFARLYRKHHKDPDVSFVNRAISDASDKTITFYENPDTPTLNTATATWFAIPRHKAIVHSFKKRLVCTITLDDAIECIGAIPAYIKIDVEGHEIFVLRGLNHKPSSLSFEWIPERREINIEVLRRARDIGFTKFYLMQEEALPTFAPGTELTYDEVVAEWESGAGPWGNVWCR